MLFLIFGGNGWIGNQFIDLLESKSVSYVRSSVRADNIQGIDEELIRLRPSHVVSFIGRTHGKIGDKVFTTIDYLEQKGKLRENVNDNLFSPLCLAILCKNHHIHFSYLGTGCIFEYDHEHPYGLEENGFTEDSLPNFFGSSYSIVKGFTDRLMKLFESSTLNLRIRMPITNRDEPRNFITKIANYEKVCSIPNSMTVLPELLPIALDLMIDKQTGTFNLTNPGLISHNEILEMYKELVDPEFTWKNFSIEEQNKILAGGRSNNFLDTTKLTTLYPHISHIRDAVRNCLATYQK
jgi:3,5-epimerase/4-reductase